MRIKQVTRKSTNAPSREHMTANKANSDESASKARTRSTSRSVKHQSKGQARKIQATKKIAETQSPMKKSTDVFEVMEEENEKKEEKRASRRISQSKPVVEKIDKEEKGKNKETPGKQMRGVTLIDIAGEIGEQKENQREEKKMTKNVSREKRSAVIPKKGGTKKDAINKNEEEKEKKKRVRTYINVEYPVQKKAKKLPLKMAGNTVEVKEESMVWQYRSNMVGLVRLIKEVKFTEAQMREIKKSPFTYLIESIISKDVDEHFVKKCEKDVLKVVQTYQRWKGKFKVGERFVSLTDMDITLIFGIQSGRKRIDLAKQSNMPTTKFVSRVFVHRQRMNISHLKEYFFKAVLGTTKESARDVSRLLTLILIATLFCTTTAPALSWSYVKYVEDLETSTSYAWSTLIKEFLLKNLDEKFDNPKSVNGCVIALLYWLCEHTGILPRVNVGQFPRFLKWRLSDLTAALRQKPLESFDPQKVIASELEPTAEERSLLSFFKVVKDEDEKEEEDKHVLEEKESSKQSKAKVEELLTKQSVLQNLVTDLLVENQLLRTENRNLKNRMSDKDDTIRVPECEDVGCCASQGTRVTISSTKQL